MQLECLCRRAPLSPTQQATEVRVGSLVRATGLVTRDESGRGSDEVLRNHSREATLVRSTHSRECCSSRARIPMPSRALPSTHALGDPTVDGTGARQSPQPRPARAIPVLVASAVAGLCAHTVKSPLWCEARPPRPSLLACTRRSGQANAKESARYVGRRLVASICFAFFLALGPGIATARTKVLLRMTISLALYI